MTPQRKQLTVKIMEVPYSTEWIQPWIEKNEQEKI